MQVCISQRMTCELASIGHGRIHFKAWDESYGSRCIYGGGELETLSKLVTAFCIRALDIPTRTMIFNFDEYFWIGIAIFLKYLRNWFELWESQVAYSVSTKWLTSPCVVNVYYNPLRLELDCYNVTCKLWETIIRNRVRVLVAIGVLLFNSLLLNILRFTLYFRYPLWICFADWRFQGTQNTIYAKLDEWNVQYDYSFVWQRFR